MDSGKMKVHLSILILLLPLVGFAAESEKKESLAQGALEDLYRKEQALLGSFYRAGLGERMKIRKKLDALQSRVRLQEALLGKKKPNQAHSSNVGVERGESPSGWLPKDRETTAMTWSAKRPEPMAWWPDSWKIRLPSPSKTEDRPERREKTILESEEIEEESFEEPLERPSVRQKKKAMLDLLSLHPRQVLSTRQILFGVPKAFRKTSWHLWEKRGQGNWVYQTEGKGDRNFSFTFQEDLSLRYTFTKRSHQPDHRDPGMYYFILDTQRPQTLKLSRKVGEYGLTQLNWRFQDINMASHPVTFRLLNAEGGVVSMEGALPAKGLHVMTTQQAKESVKAEWMVRDEAGNLTEGSLDLR